MQRNLLDDEKKLPLSTIIYHCDEPSLDFDDEEDRARYITEMCMPITLLASWSILAFLIYYIPASLNNHTKENATDHDSSGGYILSGLISILPLAMILFILKPLYPRLSLDPCRNLLSKNNMFSRIRINDDYTDIDELTEINMREFEKACAELTDESPLVETPSLRRSYGTSKDII